MNANVLEKLKILAESAKYDVSCASSGTVRANKPGTLGNTVGGWGICHSLPIIAFMIAPIVSTGVVMTCRVPLFPYPNWWI